MKGDRNTSTKSEFSSLKALKEFIFQRALKWFLNLTLIAKIVVCGLSILLVLILSRIGVFGEKPSYLSRKVIPFTIPIIDPKPADILLTFIFDVETDLGRVNGRIGRTYWSGNRIYLSINSNVECWLSIFSVDSKGVYGIYNQSKQPGLFRPQREPHVITFLLDDNVGPEIYYAVASHTKFDFVKDIKPKLENIFPDFKAKGPLFSNYRLDLGDEYYQAAISFNHK